MEYVRLKDVTLSTQYGFTASETSKTEGKYKYLRITDIVPYFVNYEIVPFCNIHEKQVPKYLVNAGDILIARTGATTGYNYVVPEGIADTVYASYLIRFVVNKEKCLPTFLKYVLKSKAYYGFVNNYIGGSAQPGMNAKVFGKFCIPNMPIDTQHRIASILSSYDSLIEKNTKRIRLLEKMAENLYKEWFVRFRFPGYEKAEMENGLPKGWKRGKLGDIVEFLNGFAFKSQTFCAEGKYSIVTIKNVRSDGFEGNNTDKVLELPSRIPKHCLLKEGDILLSLTGNIGRVCRVLGNGYLLNQRVAKLKSKNPLFCYCTFKSDYIYQSLNVISYGTAQLNLSPVKASKIKLPIPLLELLNNFEQIVKPIFAEIDTLLHQNTLLARRRDLLLPRLMSGKLEVKP